MPRPPKPSEVRRGHSNSNRATEKSGRGLPDHACPPPEPPDGLSERAQSWYQGLIESGQSRFYESSDWQLALIGAILLSDYAETKRSTTMAQFLSINRDLLSTESVRRGAMLELDHKSSQPPKRKASDEYKRALGILK